MDFQGLLNLTDLTGVTVREVERVARNAGIEFEFYKGRLVVDFEGLISIGICHRSYFPIPFLFKFEFFCIDPKAIFLN